MNLAEHVNKPLSLNNFRPKQMQVETATSGGAMQARFNLVVTFSPRSPLEE